MKRQILSIALALSLCMSIIPAAHAEETVPSPQEVYQTLIGLKEQDGYQEGTPWDDNNHDNYRWNGGPVAGNITIGSGCTAFAFELSDKAFGSLPARTYITGTFTISDVRPGDILRVENNTHSVIVLQVTDDGAILAEGNYHISGGYGQVHWGRAVDKNYVEGASFFITRYPENYTDPDDPDAGKELDSGTTGSLAWKLTNGGTLTISGSGPMPDYGQPGDAPWYAYKDKILTVQMEDGVTSVGQNAFCDMSGGYPLLTAVIPDGVTAIGVNAFYKSALLSVSIPSSVKTIGDNAFRECRNLTSVRLAEGVETLGGNVFQACTSLTSVTLPASVRSVGAAAFWQCGNLQKAVFQPGSPDVTVSMGDNMFTQCYKLGQMTLPLKIDRISEGMFQNCLYLTTLNIPQGAQSIGGQAFASCGWLSSVYIPDSVKSIGSAAFSQTGLSDIYFSGTEDQWNGVQKIGDTSLVLQNVTMHYGAQPAEPTHVHNWSAAWSSDVTHHWHDCTGAGTCDATNETPERAYGAHVYDNAADATCNTCGYTRTSSHTHVWSPVWSSNSTHHWHDCTAAGCTIVADSDKDRYAAHTPGSWIIDQAATSTTAGSRHKACTVCGAVTETETIPAHGGSSSGNNSSGSGGSNTTTTTVRNPDGSTTTTSTNNRTGAVTTITTDREGNRTKTVTQKDGSSVAAVTQKNGITATITTSAAGRVTAEVELPAAAVSEAQKNGEAIPLPIPAVKVVQDTDSAPAVTVNTGSSAPIKVEIPTAAPTPGTVAVLIKPDGTAEVIKNSVPRENRIVTELPGGAAVKIVENSRHFADVPAEHWAADAICFVSARELFSGTGTDVFSPDLPTTRAMLMTVLARLDGADINGGKTWYEKGLEWAVARGVSDGSNPQGNISREQLAVMLWRHAGSPSASVSLAGFTDAGEASSYAREALRWAVENDIIHGFGNGYLAPQGHAARAQVAQMLKNFIDHNL